MPLSESQKWVVFGEFLTFRCFPTNGRPRGEDLTRFLRDRLGLTSDEIEGVVARMVGAEKEEEEEVELTHLDEVGDHDWLATG